MDIGMEFETTIRMLFGKKKAYQIAGTETQWRERRRWLLKAVRKMMRDANRLDTIPQHKRMLLAELEAVSGRLVQSREISWSLAYRLLRVSMSLLGYVPDGARCYTPIFCQTPNQYYTAAILTGGDALQHYYDRKNAIAIRGKIVIDLIQQGLDTFTISLVLNTTEYEVKRLRSSSHRLKSAIKPE